ncbi:M36 family metallopeptidase [Pendulispora albinea]|uniref:M36 family metallopeptidase n=1 Tax=Pendulispora albinea TaxID=2741071 RepID=A0ABZ2MBG5_9BACT
MRYHWVRFGALTATCAMLVGLTMCGDGASSRPGPSPSDSSANEDTARKALAETPLGYVASRHGNGKARFILGAPGALRAKLDVGQETAARLHLERHAEALGLSEAAVREAPAEAAHPLANGAMVVQFGQRVNGIEVFHTRTSVVLDETKNLVSIASNLHSVHSVKDMPFDRSAESALTTAYTAWFGATLPDGAVRDLGPRSGDIRGYAVQTPAGAPRIVEATAKRVFFPEGLELVPAYYVELTARAPRSKANQAYAYVVSANDGRVLHETSLVAHEAFTYRVWADPDAKTNHIPTDGPYADYSPHPGGIPDRKRPDFQPPIAVQMEGFNKNPQGKPDPWLGPNDTVTFGNNARAYSDRSDQHKKDDAGNSVDSGDGYDEGIDLRAEVTSPRTFDRTYDITQAPNASDDQIKAAVTQLFYVNNWLHDYWYDSGFDERSGNAQLSNYGRGGVEGDPLRVEAQDGADYGEANNANMITYADGTSPRMQMYVWTGLPNRRLELVPDTQPPTRLDDWLGAPAYGPQTFDDVQELVLAADGVAPTTDACEPITNDVAHKFVVIERSAKAGCTFYLRTSNAQAANAAGVIIINNNPAGSHEFVNPAKPDVEPNIHIPVLTTTSEDGAKLKSAMAASATPLRARMFRGVETPVDGTIDNTIVAHEWGHYLHHRLVACSGRSWPADPRISVGSCSGMSEGWADFNALFMVVREGDAIEGSAYPLGQYANVGASPNAAYFGTRRAPYSTDTAKNPFTFGHVAQGAPAPQGAPLEPGGSFMQEAHNIGEIWAQILFEGYVNLQKAGQKANPPRSFQEVKRRMANYLVAGMKAAPVDPTFTEQRDAILAGVWATGNQDDFEALAQGFAKRGLGVGAVAPPASSVTMAETRESFANKGELVFVDARIDDSLVSCDHDGVLDAGETGLLTVRVRNPGWKTLTGTKVNVRTADPNITFGSGGEVTLGAVDPYGVATATILVTSRASTTKQAILGLDITLTNAEAFAPTVTATTSQRYNFDIWPNTSATDDAESGSSVWSVIGAAGVWSRQGDATNHVLHGNDLGKPSDSSLVSPDLIVGQNDFTISFKHRYAFEASGTSYYDGGVLEISSNGGVTWSDISAYADPQYPRTLRGGNSTNPLKGRKAWSGEEKDAKTVSLNLGKALAGKTVKVRFRIGTDTDTGAAGWDIDDIAFGGITNKPFATRVDGACTLGADAGTGGGNNPPPDAGSPPAGGANPDHKVTMSDDGCSVSAAGASGSKGAAMLALLSALLPFVRLARRRLRRG